MTGQEMTKEELKAIDLGDIYEMLNEDYFDGMAPPLESVNIRWSSRLWRFVGTAAWGHSRRKWNWKTNEIVLSLRHHMRRGLDCLLETMLHEMLHLDLRRNDKDPVFQRGLIRLGLPRWSGGAPLEAVVLMPKRVYHWRYHYICDCGYAEVRKKRAKHRRIRCRDCGDDVYLDHHEWFG